MPRIFLTYPEKRSVDESQVITWAADALANKETDQEARDVFEACDILEDLGHITVDWRQTHFKGGR